MGGEKIDLDWPKAIISVLSGESGTESSRPQVKKLRKMVMLSLQVDESDKGAKKLFKKAVQAMEEEGTVRLDADGTINLLSTKKRKSDKDKEQKKKKRKLSKEEKKSKKKREETGEEEEEETNDGAKDRSDVEDGAHDDTDKSLQEGNIDAAPSEPDNLASDDDKNKPCKGNSQGVTRLFLGNLPFAVDESSLSAFLPGTVTHIKWITDKETGKFYGSAFVEMDNSVSAADAVAMADSKLIGRPVKINFAPSREGDVWPPPKSVVSGGSTTGGQAGGKGVKAMSAKPDNCVKLFIGNLSYDIDDEGITKFFASVDAEVKAVRWLHHRDSGDFKGVGFVEFWNTEACEKAATLNGKNLLGRPIRIDWTD